MDLSNKINEEVITILGLQYIANVANMPLVEVAEKLSIKPQQIHEWTSLKKGIPEKYSTILEELFGIPFSLISKEVNEVDQIRILQIYLNFKERGVFNMKKIKGKISVINYKGGVGKTTFSFNIATILSLKGNKVLLVDVDHQANLSRVCKIGDSFELAEYPNISNIFSSYVQHQSLPGTEIILKAPLGNRYPNLDILPSIEDLGELEFDLAETMRPANETPTWTKRTLICDWIDKNKLEYEYDYIIFDCPPATMYITQNALAASDYYIVPVVPSELSIRGLLHLVRMIENRIYDTLRKEEQKAKIDKGVSGNIFESFSPNIDLLGIVFNMAQVAGNAGNKWGVTKVHARGISSVQKLEKMEPIISGKVWYDEIINRTTNVENAIGIPEHHEVFRNITEKIVSEIERRNNNK